jgi:hypothetical protein
MIKPYNQTDKGNIFIHLKVIANSSRNELCNVVEDSNGQQILKVKITATPENGKANKALIKFLAQELGISSANIEIISGHTSPHKKLLIKDKQCILPIFPIDKKYNVAAFY